jgi:hypothetical protein
MAINTALLEWATFEARVDSLNVSKTSPQYSHCGDSSCSMLHRGHFVIEQSFFDLLVML